jgi:tetratricopeptide (TPR) repeat protein
VLELLDEAAAARVVSEAPGASGRMRFAHALIRDAAYEGLPYRVRRDLHSRVGERIERATYPNLDEQAEVLALHYAAADRHDATWIHARIAARRASDLYANVDAASFFERALEAARHVKDVPEEMKAELFEGLGDIRERLGEYQSAAAAYRSARRLLAGDRVAEGRLMLKEGWIADRSGRFAEALRWIGRALRLLEGVGGVRRGRPGPGPRLLPARLGPDRRGENRGGGLLRGRAGDLRRAGRPGGTGHRAQ